MILLLIAALALNVFVKYRRSKKTPLGNVASILIDINRNEKNLENFNYSQQAKKMKTGSWNSYKDKIDFLPQEIHMELGQTFEMCQEVNDRINAAKNYKSSSYMAGIDVSKLEVPLARCKEALQIWLQENMNNPEYQPKKRRGLFGGLFGGFGGR
jgi:hypothetical protein